MGILRYKVKPSVSKVVATNQLKVAFLLLSVLLFVHSRGEGVNSYARAEEVSTTSADYGEVRGVIWEVNTVSPVCDTRERLTCLNR